MFEYKSGRIHYVNELFEQDFNISSLNGTLSDFLAVVQLEDRLLLKSQLTLIDNDAIEGLILRRIMQESIRYFKCNFYSIKQGDQIFALLEDVTEHVESNDSITKHNAQKNAILTILSHDVVGSLNTASTLIDFASQRVRSGDVDNVVAALKAVKDISTSNVSMIGEFLRKEFLSSLNVPLSKVRNDVVECLGSLIAQYRLVESDLAVEMDFRFNKEQIYLKTDRDKLIQIFNNLISNALKFTPKGGRITLSAIEEHNRVELSVEDTGVGIPNDLKKHIFSKFSLARRRGLSGEQSHGIGLWAIKQMVEWLGGDISFESQEQKGTRFLVTFFKEKPPH
ncbi:MAG: sensor histidine kinase [Sphingobacterium hotanense]